MPPALAVGAAGSGLGADADEATTFAFPADHVWLDTAPSLRFVYQVKTVQAAVKTGSVPTTMVDSLNAASTKADGACG